MRSIPSDRSRSANLHRVLSPHSIALVGATDRPGSFGARTIANLAGFDGTLHLVNAKYDRVEGHRCHASLRELPQVPDAVIVALPGPLVHASIEECADLGVGGVIVYASGYAETGAAADIERQARLAALARDTGLRVLGPNCMGVVNYRIGAVQSFQQFPPACAPTGHSIGLVSQSGALALSLSQAVERGVAFSHILTFGNGADVDIADLIEYLVDDDQCRAIACVFEGVAQPERLVRAAALAARRGKPLIVCKLATGEAGARAALSHTGTLAGSERMYRAALEQYGTVFVDDFETLLDMAAFFAKAPAPTAPGAGIVVASGGAGIMAVDKAERHAVPLPAPMQETRHILEANIPAFGSAANPCDVTAEVVKNPQSLHACLQAMAGDPAYGALVVAQTVAGDAFTPRLAQYADVARRYGKPVCAVWLSAWQNGPGAREFGADPHVPVFHSMDDCFLALARWQWRAGLMNEADAPVADTDAGALNTVRHALADDAQGHMLTEHQAKTLLSRYGIPVNRESRALTRQEAVDAAEAIGYPVALKLESPDVPHKTEAGVVRLSLPDRSTLEQAWEDIMARAHALSPAPRILGMLVQEMVPAGVELIVGARIEPGFGPFIVVGLGGVLVEIMRDSAIAPAPVTPARARALLGSLKGAPLLAGYRGSPAVDLDALAETISRISRFIADHAERIAELDVNPLICTGRRIVAVDALIVRRQ